VRLIILPVVIIALFPLTACGFGGLAFEPLPDNGVHFVEMTSTLGLYPSEVHIMAGETVEWRNRSLFAHTVTDGPAKASSTGDSALPPGAQPFSAKVAPGEIYRHTFVVPGKYLYFCEPHEEFDMLGRVVVDRPA